MMKAWKRCTLVVLAGAVTALSGCSSTDSPQEALISAITKTNEAKTFTYTGSFTINDIQLPQAAGTVSGKDAMLRMALPILLKGAVIQVHGAVQKDPQRAELTLDATLGTGDVKLTAKIPIIVTADKIYMKVPQIPGVAIPEAIAGHFVVIDAKKLAEEQGSSDLLSGSEAPKLGKDMLAALFDSLDEGTYFSEPAAADVKNLPSGYKADRYVRMTIDGQHADAALTSIAEKAIPKIIDLLMQDDVYMKSLGLTKERLEASKKELTADNLKDRFKIKTLAVTGGITDDYLTFETGDIQLDSADLMKGMKLDVHFSLAQDKINQAVKFEVELPKDAVPVTNLDQLMP